MAYATANLTIKKDQATVNATGLYAKFTVSRANDDTARMVRVIILLPVDVKVIKAEVTETKKGIEGYRKSSPACSDKCEVTWESSIAISRIPNSKYDSYVSIDLAYLNGDETAVIEIATTLPSDKTVPQTFGAFVYGSLPDIDHKYNYVVAKCI